MNSPIDLSRVFGRFSGREVPMTEEKEVLKLRNGIERTYTYVHPANDKDPVLEDMHNQARKHGLTLRVWWKGVAGTMDYRTDRVNAHIEKSPDGKWRVSNRFNLG